MVKQTDQFEQQTGVDLSALEEQISTVPAERPAVAKLISNRPNDAELAEAFKKRMLTNLAEQGTILDEMKAAGPFACNFQWGVDATGRHFVSAIQMTRVYP